jgi:hypothetical protein
LYLDAALGADMAWADLGAARGAPHVKDLAAAARAEKERVAEGAQCLLVLDNVRNADDLLALMPLESRTPPFVFVVAEKPTGLTDDIVPVNDVPPQGAKRLAEAMTGGKKDGEPVPPVRVLDGLAITMSVGARAALAWQGKQGPIMLDDTEAAVQRLVPLLAKRTAVLEVMLMTSVMHPSRQAVDAIFTAVLEVRRERGGGPKPQEIGEAVMVLAQAGLVQPEDERRISVHPLVQQAVRDMAQSDQDLAVARQCVAAGLVSEARDALAE